MFGRKNELSELAKEAERRKDEALKELDASCDALMEVRARAESITIECFDLLSSMRSAPFTMRRRVRSIERAKRRFDKSDDIVRKQFARDTVVTGAAVVAAGGILGAVYRFRNEIQNLFRKRPPLAIAGLLGIAVGVSLAVSAIGGLFVRRSAQEWAEFTEECLKEARAAAEASQRAKNRIAEISRQAELLETLFSQLKGLHDARFKSLSDGDRGRIWQLLLNAESLAKDLNMEVIA